MTTARIDTDKYNSDIVLYNQIADVFMLFLPGLLTGLMKICMEDEKIGHKVIKVFRTTICEIILITLSKLILYSETYLQQM